MALVLTGSLVVISILLNFLQIQADTPFTTYVLLNMNISILMIFSYFLSMPIYSIKVPDWVKWSARNKANHNFKISFLLAAHNEEKYIKKCIESIDNAASNYRGSVEIIIVNDGSTDGSHSIASRAIESLRNCSGQLFDIQNSGKGFALTYGLEKTSGEIIFRIDADCVFDEKGINLVAKHFRDPRVASVGGLILPLETKSILQKTVYLKFVYFLFVVKRGQELLDSILVQAGGYSVFRKEALLRIGGAWKDNQFGEDGELTHRIARSGYKTELELRSVVYSEVPEKLIDFMGQRSRWNIAFYHSRARNLELLKEWRSPRSFVFLTDLIAHGASFGMGLTWPLVIAAVVTQSANFSLTGFLGIPILNAVVIQLVLYSLQITILFYYLKRFGKLGFLKYFPFLRIVGFVLSLLVKPMVMDILLSWSSKRKHYDKESFESLRSEMKKNIDPLH
jgi:cellulose synthase/poly-beta-1,6-N-acetylglucosamine synthase-like glycosyltransferase